jgi:hypothetical protein
MTTRPSLGVSAYLVVKNGVLEKVFSSSQTLVYLVSTVDSTKYCNGVDMDSEGYRATITKQLTTNTPEVNPTTMQKIKTLINVATTGMCTEVLNQLNITENNGVVTIPQFGAWAGVSISMCSCKPQVEVNLLRLPGINKVVWQ